MPSALSLLLMSNTPKCFAGYTMVVLDAAAVPLLKTPAYGVRRRPQPSVAALNGVIG